MTPVNVTQTSRSHGIRRWALTGALLGFAGSVLFAAPANAAVTPAQPARLFAAEVAAPEGDPVTTASCGSLASLPGMADPADLPAGSTAAVNVEGPLQSVTGNATCRTWNIGGVPVAAPFSADPQIPSGTVVRATGAAKVAPSTKIVADRIRSRNETGVGAATVDLLYLAQMTVVRGDVVLPGLLGPCITVPVNTWTVRDQVGQTYTLDVSAARAAGAIDPCTAAGARMGVEFDLNPIADAAPAAGGPTLFDLTTLTGILAPVTDLVGGLVPGLGGLLPTGAAPGGG
jgi:hypothetical protein